MNDIATTRLRREPQDKAIPEIQRSFSYATRNTVATSGTGRPMKYGDRIHVRLARVQPGGNVLVDFVLDTVNDMCDVYGELRFHTRGKRGLTTLYVRNITRGWAFSQPFMLYDNACRPAVSVSRPIQQPTFAGDGGPRHPWVASHDKQPREIPESIRLLFGDH